MAENVEVAIVGTKLEEDVFWTVPLVQYFLLRDIRDHPVESGLAFVRGEIFERL